MEIEEFKKIVQNKRKERFKKTSNEVKLVVSAFMKLTQDEKRDALSFMYTRDASEMENPTMTQKEIEEMHKSLLETVIYFLEDYDAAEIDTLRLTIDGLRESNSLMGVSAFTDSSLELGHYNANGEYEIIGMGV